MRHFPYLDVIFSNHKCYVVDKESKKTTTLGMEDHELYKLVELDKLRSMHGQPKVH